MPIPRPDRDELSRIARSLGFRPDGDELAALSLLTDALLAGLDAVEAIPEPARPPAPKRDHWAPLPDQNRYRAWVLHTDVRERDEGRLAGRSLVLKDNIALAGVPLAGGSDFLQGWVPEEDATVVRRVLDEGARIVGKAACEYLSLSAGSHTSATGPVRNPRELGHTTGGSSSGCAALVAAGEVDLAIGGDQGGSIRLPASFTGIVGMKPTHGLVPYTGILSLDAHIDHTGPMTATVADNALLLEVLAGPDGVDTRQRGVRTARYAEIAGRDAAGLRVGVLEEGFAPADPEVASCVRAAAERLSAAGVEARSVSVPEHAAVAVAALPFLVLGGFEIARGLGFASHANQPVPFGLPEAFARWHAYADGMPVMLKTMLLGGAVADAKGGRLLYAKALRLQQAARDAYDRALAGCDALLLPTTPCTAPRLPHADAEPAELVAASSRGIANTSQFDVSGHPAVSVPCGEIAGLPVGCMLVGRHFDEATLYRLASAIEAR